MNEGDCGDGGIPGYIFSWLVPNEYTLKHLPVALAHEVNHNVRFQFIRMLCQWKGYYVDTVGKDIAAIKKYMRLAGQ